MVKCQPHQKESVKFCSPCKAYICQTECGQAHNGHETIHVTYLKSHTLRACEYQAKQMDKALHQMDKFEKSELDEFDPESLVKAKGVVIKIISDMFDSNIEEFNQAYKQEQDRNGRIDEIKAKIQANKALCEDLFQKEPTDENVNAIKPAISDQIEEVKETCKVDLASAGLMEQVTEAFNGVKKTDFLEKFQKYKNQNQQNTLLDLLISIANEYKSQ